MTINQLPPDPNYPAPGDSLRPSSEFRPSEPGLPRPSTFSVPPSSRPPLVAPPASVAPRVPSKVVALSDIPEVKPASAPVGAAVASKAAAQLATATKAASRVMGVEALQKRIETEQKARHKAEEQNMMMRLELGEARKEILQLKRQVQQLERDLSRVRPVKK